ncbi:hypothetical protein [Roseovarius salinarum]|uniref:hypothetical protein n=1 Tax=Roseovarius salinarum TaxID=1981892 RepID=UPI000C34E81A|nr:hypothetical protein [Roseovarius salinarum]
MSDPVTNAEIEDVLSSIRRLVSSEDRDPRRESDAEQPDDTTGESGETGGAGAAAADGAADRLVLTPSQRVNDVDAGDPDPSETGDTGALAATDALDTGDAATEPGETEEQPFFHHHRSAPPWHAGGLHPEGDDAADTPAPVSDAAGSAGGAHDAAAVLRARVAEFEAIIAAQNEQWEPDGTSDDAYAGGPTEALPWEDYVPGADSAGTYDEAEAPADASDEPGGDAASEAEVEAEAPAAPRVETEPENAHADDHADMGADDDETSDNWVADQQDAVLDEDALRELVSQIVREELQGTLGERITRNVRKLVRREIHRALASQELE